jgi:hypothetical protein
MLLENKSLNTLPLQSSKNKRCDKAANLEIKRLVTIPSVNMPLQRNVMMAVTQQDDVRQMMMMMTMQTHHTSHITHHTSHITHHTSHNDFDDDAKSWKRDAVQSH